jgi:uncharacterized membrane protein
MADRTIIIALAATGWSAVLLIWAGMTWRELSIMRRRNRRKRGRNRARRRVAEIVRLARETGADWIREAK